MRRLLPSLIFLLAAAPAFAGQAALPASGAIAPRIQLTPVAALDFGEIIAPDPAAAGSYRLDAAGVPTAVNATQVGTPSRGAFTLRGRAGQNITLSIAGGAFACTPAYGTCTGTPGLGGLVNTFTTTGTGQLSASNCTGSVCTDTVYFGGRLDFNGTDEGEWIGTVTVTAGYQ